MRPEGLERVLTTAAAIPEPRIVAAPSARLLLRAIAQSRVAQKVNTGPRRRSDRLEDHHDFAACFLGERFASTPAHLQVARVLRVAGRDAAIDIIRGRVTLLAFIRGDDQTAGEVVRLRSNADIRVGIAWRISLRPE